MKRRIRHYAELRDGDASGVEDQLADRRARLERSLAGVDRTVAILGGKGGVGKSLVSAALATALARRGLRVGLVDADLQGPTAARMLGNRRARLGILGDTVTPAAGREGVAFVSADLLTEGDAPLRWRGGGSESFVWRGAQERGMLEDFLADVRWGDRDLLLIDLPPGVGRLEQLAGLLPDLDGLLAVTLPPAASASSVGRTLAAARSLGLPLLGLVENMTGYACPACGHTGALFPGRAGEELAAAHGVPLLVRIPFDPGAAGLADAGQVARLLRETRAGAALERLAGRLRLRLELPGESGEASPEGTRPGDAPAEGRGPGEGSGGGGG